MTRKDFELVAQTIKDLARGFQNPPGMDMGKYTAFTFADAIQRENANFDRARFLKACGYPQPKGE